MCLVFKLFCFKITLWIWRSMKSELWWFLSYVWENWGSERSDDLHGTHSQYVSGAGFDLHLSIFKTQNLLTSVLFCLPSQVLPLICKGTLCNSFFIMTCNTRKFDWMGFHIFLLKILTRLCHMNKMHHTFTWDEQGHVSKKRHYSPSLLFKFI